MPTPLPKLKHVHWLNFKESNIAYDARFYPYDVAGTDPVFAVASVKNLVLFRPLIGAEDAAPRLEELRSWKVPNPYEEWNSLTWARDPTTEDPFICVAGKERVIYVFNIYQDNPVEILIGHGQCINDLKTSPTQAWLVASASEDHTARIWDLRPELAQNRTRAILGGRLGHRSGLLTIAFHHNGRYVLTGGFDGQICLWLIPDFTEIPSDVDHTIKIHYPHFSTTEIHSDFVDSVSFLNDWVLSRASNTSTEPSVIHMWKIDGFKSSNPLPRRELAPTAGAASQANAPTRSAFVNHSHARDGRLRFSAQHPYFKILYTFETPACDMYYMRFGVFYEPGKSPILAMADGDSSALFWDIGRVLEEQQMAAKTRNRNAIEHSRRDQGEHVEADVKSDSVPTPSINDPSGEGLGDSNRDEHSVAGRYQIISLRPIEAHWTEAIQSRKRKGGGGCAVAWSPIGDICVVATAKGGIGLFLR